MGNFHYRKEPLVFLKPPKWFISMMSSNQLLHIF